MLCPKCGLDVPDDRDSCEHCGHYVRGFGRTEFSAGVELGAAEPGGDGAVTERTPREATRRYAVAPPPPRARADQVVVTLRLPTEEAAGAEEVSAAVEPGGEVVLVALVRNQSAIVDSYTLRVKGLPAEWTTIAPASVHLVPFGAAGEGYEAEVEVRLRPPRASEARAGPWPFAVVATSKAQEADVAAARGTLVIGRFDELAECELRPERESGRRKASFAVAVRNRGNAPVTVALSLVDAEEATRPRFEEEQLAAEPGQKVGTAFVLRPRKPLFFGRPEERRFEVAARVAESELPPVRKQGVFRQKAWIPRWVPAAIPLVAVPIAAVLLFLPHKVAVPDLTGKSADAAQKLLTQSQLTIATKDRKVADKANVGLIVDQDPGPGSKVSKKTEITVWVGTGSGLVRVPDLCGKSLADADKALRKAGLPAPTVGGTPPASTDVALAAKGCQLPGAGELVKAGTVVAVILTKPKSVTTSTNGGTTTTSPQLPVVAGLTAAAAAAELAKQGLPYTYVRQLSADKPPGTVLGVDGNPAPGAPVPLLVSAGAPKLVYDDGHDLFLVGSGPGDQPAAFTPSIPSDEQEATLNDAGTAVAYIGVASGATAGTLYVADTTTKAATALTTDTADYHRPAFAPALDSDLLAVIKQPPDGSASDGDLCFVHTRAPAAPSCIVDKTWNVTRPTWSPDGTAILVSATNVTDNTKSGLFEYVSKKPFADKAGAWRPKGLVVDGSIPYAAWSPDGSQVAYVVQSTSGFQVFVAPVRNGVLGQGAALPSTQSCVLSWRSDGRLALSEYDCGAGGTGQIVLIDPAHPDQQTRLAASGANPSFQPVVVPLGG